MPLGSCSERRLRGLFTRCLAALVVIFFLVSVYLCFRLLTYEDCNCPPPSIIVHHSDFQLENRKFSSNHKLAVLVPFRDRFEELLEFVPHIHIFLNEQEINHDIFILNQVDRYRFNRASLINAGYLETKANYDYIAMHDVDLLPLNKNLSYAYPKDQPFHVAAPNLHPKYHYEKFVGGILLINREHFSLVNGMSNRYWGWGLEDDEFYVRLRDANLSVNRPVNITTGTNNTFRDIHGKHRRRDTTKCFNQKEVTRKRDRQTGLHDVNYKIMGIKSMKISGAPLTVINIELVCDISLTPWCDCSKVENVKIKR